MGFPIRKSSGQRLLTPHRRLSQRATSFIACACQGIHQMPLPHAREPTPPTAILIAQNRCRPCGIFTQHQSILNASPLRDRPKDQPHRNRRIPHRFLEPIHNVKDGKPNAPLPVRPDLKSSSPGKVGGACRDRTDDLKLAKLALSQLS